MKLITIKTELIKSRIEIGFQSNQIENKIELVKISKNEVN